MPTQRRFARAARDLLPRATSAEMGIIGVVLVAIVAVAGGLGYQAHVANRANVATARNALTQYSSVAAWQFARNAQREMQQAADVTIGLRVQRASHTNGHRSSDLLTPAELRASTSGDCDCKKALSVDQFFRWDAGADNIVTETPWPANDGQSIAARLARSSPGNCELLIDVDANGSPRLIAVVASYDNARRLRAVYGAIVPISEAAAIFTRVINRESLLPTVLLSRASQDSTVVISVSANGRTIFAHGPTTKSDFIATDSLGTTAFPAVVQAGLLPAIADRLIIGGLPRSRLPLIGLFVALSLVLLAVALRQMRRTLELARLRSDFVSSVSHELRTPLSLVRVYTETLIDDSGVDRDQRGRFLGVILKETNRLSRLVENLLRFADLERRHMSVTLAPADLGVLLGAAVADFRPLAESSEVDVQGEFECGLAALVDAAAVRQMVFNLLTNAVKFGGSGTRIVVTLARVVDHAQVFVDDEGPGIHPSQRRRVFERYVRLANVEAGGPAGSGIGLAIVRELAHAQHMSVWIDDSPLGGTRVVLSVPLIDVASDGNTTDSSVVEAEAEVGTSA